MKLLLSGGRWRSVLLALGASTALADPNPQDPCAPGRNPTTLCDPTITVVNEPPGANCEFGGVKITVVKGKHDERTARPR